MVVKGKIKILVGGADAVMNPGVTAFIREFQGSSF